MMDREWMNGNRMSIDYENGVEKFCTFAKDKGEDYVHCPCMKCCNLKKVRVSELRDHLLSDGIDPSYKVWSWHGEKVLSSPMASGIVRESQNEEIFVDQDDDSLADMIQGIADNLEGSNTLDNLLSDAKKPLYQGCTKFTLLSAILKLYSLKAGNGWSDKSFTTLLQLLKEMLPEGNELPDCTYEAKKILCPMGIGYKKIHACPNDCILYLDEHRDLNRCPKCNTLRYKLKSRQEVATTSAPAKAVWYLPIIPRILKSVSKMKLHTLKRSLISPEVSEHIFFSNVKHIYLNEIGGRWNLSIRKQNALCYLTNELQREI